MKSTQTKQSVKSRVSKKTWTDKLKDPTKQPIIKKLDKDFADMPAGAKMLIATPQIIENYVRQIPAGKDVPLLTMRKDLAAEYGADYTCPVTSGIFLRIVGEAAVEQHEAGKPLKSTTPFWRVVNAKSPLNKKFSFGPDFVTAQRKKEKLS
jgi:hypothetical protein